MSERWFSEQELQDMTRPTMDRAIEALDHGDLQRARELCEEMKHEWRYLHDMMVEGVAGLISFVQDRLGDGGVADAWTYAQNRGWKSDVQKIAAADRKQIVHALAATWRAHSCSGTGAHPGAFTITEDDQKFTFEMNPCGSGQRLVRRGRYEGPDAFGVTHAAHDWSYGRKGFPLYCTHCSFMNEQLPIRWIGYPIYPSDPPDDYGRDPCTWYWYKDPADIPERHWRRYGLSRARGAADAG
jgi:hypothetical protein